MRNEQNNLPLATSHKFLETSRILQSSSDEAQQLLIDQERERNFYVIQLNNYPVQHDDSSCSMIIIYYSVAGKLLIAMSLINHEIKYEITIPIETVDMKKLPSYGSPRLLK